VETPELTKNIEKACLFDQPTCDCVAILRPSVEWSLSDLPQSGGYDKGKQVGNYRTFLGSVTGHQHRLDAWDASSNIGAATIQLSRLAPNVIRTTDPIVQYSDGIAERSNLRH
jgi:hypothetical protein